MSVKITYFVHGTTIDNEKNLCTGWAPGELSELGIQQSKELGTLVTHMHFDALFCSDLKRAVDSAKIGFENTYKIIQDKRLRECNYGDLNQTDESNVDYTKHIETPFPNGESLKNVEKRIYNFFDFLKTKYECKHVALLAHKAPQLALEVLLNKKTWGQAIAEDWRNKKAWQPGWEYVIEG
ncbi:MAG: histidine phosphatase family protein [Patescibacteria group bacterium]